MKKFLIILCRRAVANRAHTLRAAANHQHIYLIQHRNFTIWFCNCFHSCLLSI